jgi:3-(3-hydroxy-phenyl)propionate hydroxylase
MAGDTDRVLVVGAGPVGVMAATFLAREGIPVTLIEATRDIAKDLRASTFHPPTLDMLKPLGIVERLIDRGLICPKWQFRDRREGVVATFDLGVLAQDTAFPFRLQCEQWKLTELLREVLDASPNVTVVYEASAVEMSQDENGVALTIERPDGSRELLKGRFLIGADGARSAIRRFLGVNFEGLTIPEIYLTMSTTHEFTDEIKDLAPIAYITDPTEWAVLLRTPSLWRVLLPTDPNQTEAEMMRPDVLQARLQALCPTGADYEIVHATGYRVHERVADRYIGGNVFLAGDAAHLNNPLGGMGMNGGIHDAFNLTTKLAAVWRGAPLETMGRYERQRRKVALETVQAQTIRNRQMMNEQDPVARRAYHDELRGIADDPVKHRTYLLRSSMIQSLRDLDEVA